MIAQQPGRRARVHALVRAQRALARAGRVPVRGQPAAAGVQRPPVHRELPLEARARHALHAPGPVHRRGARARSPPTPASAFTTSTPTRTATRWSSTSASSTTRRSWRTSTSNACAPASRSPGRSCGGSGSTPSAGTVELRAPQRRRDRAAADQLRPLQRAPLPLRLGRRGGASPAGWRPSSRSTSSAARRPSGRSPAASRASPCSSPSPTRATRTTGVLLSIVLDADRGTRSCWCLDAASLERARARRGAAPHPVRLSRPVRARLSRLGDSSHATDPANLIERSHSDRDPTTVEGAGGLAARREGCRARRSTPAQFSHRLAVAVAVLAGALAIALADGPSTSAQTRASSTRCAPSRTRSAPQLAEQNAAVDALLGQVSALRQREDAVAAELAEARGEARRGQERPRRRSRDALAQTKRRLTSALGQLERLLVSIYRQRPARRSIAAARLEASTTCHELAYLERIQDYQSAVSSDGSATFAPPRALTSTRSRPRSRGWRRPARRSRSASRHSRPPGRRSRSASPLCSAAQDQRREPARRPAGRGAEPRQGAVDAGPGARADDRRVGPAPTEPSRGPGRERRRPERLAGDAQLRRHRDRARGRAGGGQGRDRRREPDHEHALRLRRRARLVRVQRAMTARARSASRSTAAACFPRRWTRRDS